MLDYSGEVLGRYYEIQNLEKVETVANSHVKSEFYSVEDILEPLWGRRDEDGNLTVKQLFGFEGLQPSQLPWGDKQVSVDDIFRQYAISWGKKYIYSCMRDIGTRNIETVALFNEPISIRDSYKYYWNNDARCDELLYTIELDSFDESHMESLTEEKVAGYFKSLGFNVDSNKYTLDDLIIEYELRNNTMFFDMYKKSSRKHIEFADLIYEYM
ncbi:MAG: hypothetical protein MJY84_02925 [Bacteroidales bacterium]|nr:hypothetical protein [Bacteroidales bacterium]